MLRQIPRVFRDRGKILLHVFRVTVVVIPDGSGEGVAVEKAVTVDAAARIMIFQPRSSHANVLFINDKWNAGLTQTYCRQKTALPGTNDAD